MKVKDLVDKLLKIQAINGDNFEVRLIVEITNKDGKFAQYERVVKDVGVNITTETAYLTHEIL